MNQRVKGSAQMTLRIKPNSKYGFGGPQIHY